MFMMYEKLDLNSMLDEIKEDLDLVDTSPTKILSQEEIHHLILEKRRANKKER